MLKHVLGLDTDLCRPVLAGLLLLPTGLLALGCKADGPPDPEPGPLSGELRLAPVPTLRLGGLDAGGHQSFGRVRAARFVGDSLIAVVDGVRDEVDLFDRDGALRRIIGGPGDGPGEFRSLRDAVYRGGRVHAWDAMAWRLSRFEPDGEFVDDAAFRETSGFRRFVGVLADGSWLVRSHPANRALGSKEGVVRESATFLLISPEGDVLRRDSRPGLEMLYETVHGRKMGSSLLLSPNTLAAAVGDLVVFGESGSGRLEAVDASGAAVAEGRLPGAARKATEAELSAVEARRSIPTPPPELGVRVPETTPPGRREIFPRFDRFLVDAGERLWIREAAGPFDETRRWWRFGPDLRPAGILSVDAAVELLDARGREALVMTTDSLDVATIELRELTEVRGAAASTRRSIPTRSR